MTRTARFAAPLTLILLTVLGTLIATPETQAQSHDQLNNCGQVFKDWWTDDSVSWNNITDCYADGLSSDLKDILLPESFQNAGRANTRTREFQEPGWSVIEKGGNCIVDGGQACSDFQQSYDEFWDWIKGKAVKTWADETWRSAKDVIPQTWKDLKTEYGGTKRTYDLSVWGQDEFLPDVAQRASDLAGSISEGLETPIYQAPNLPSTPGGSGYDQPNNDYVDSLPDTFVRPGDSFEGQAYDGYEDPWAEGTSASADGGYVVGSDLPQGAVGEADDQLEMVAVDREDDLGYDDAVEVEVDDETGGEYPEEDEVAFDAGTTEEVEREDDLEWDEEEIEEIGEGDDLEWDDEEIEEIGEEDDLEWDEEEIEEIGEGDDLEWDDDEYNFEDIDAESDADDEIDLWDFEDEVSPDGLEYENDVAAGYEIDQLLADIAGLETYDAEDDWQYFDDMGADSEIDYASEFTARAETEARRYAADWGAFEGQYGAPDDGPRGYQGRNRSERRHDRSGEGIGSYGSSCADILVTTEAAIDRWEQAGAAMGANAVSGNVIGMSYRELLGMMKSALQQTSGAGTSPAYVMAMESFRGAIPQVRAEIDELAALTAQPEFYPGRCSGLANRCDTNADCLDSEFVIVADGHGNVTSGSGPGTCNATDDPTARWTKYDVDRLNYSRAELEVFEGLSNYFACKSGDSEHDYAAPHPDPERNGGGGPSQLEFGSSTGGQECWPQGCPPGKTCSCR